ncbi:hypothetical protein FSP39_001720 [Pinctada imbricata]|uniref:Telomere-associated protein Rif1 N-terminal domain-containing protein n=1 Tax=Pinctada imbricata TaxID=66713 RepID=A0AA89CDP5_PINIB|nr:hypothetical protein FSP39_001720 [Pinctada imbricata]
MCSTHFFSHLNEDNLSIFSIDLANNAKLLWHIMEGDLAHDNIDLCQVVLQILGYCLNDLDSVSHLSQEECKSALSSLCQCVLKTEDKLTCTRALWCLNRQNLPVDVVRKEVQQILRAVEHSFGKWKGQSTVENEAGSVVYRLLEQCPKDTRQHAVLWGKLVLPLLVHGAVKIREKAFDVIKKELSTLACNQKELGSWLSTEFKSRIFPEMKKILSAHTVYVLQVWEMFVQISGKELHRGGYINAMLPIVEQGFKNSDTRIQAFQAWQQLINNFATNPEILTDQRRVKLIMQVFKTSNAKIEDVAKVKLQVWWHFVWLLGARASAYFEQVCIPLLNFCLGGDKRSNPVVNTPRANILQNGASPITPRLNLPGSGGQSKTPQPSFLSIQLKGCEILVHFLGHPKVQTDLPAYTFTIDSLNHDIITGPAFFIKHANVLVSTTTDFTSSLGENLPEPLLFRLWYSLIAHMRNGLENSVKGEMRESFTTLLTQFQNLTLSQALPHKTVLGTPALFLTELLLTPSLLKPCSTMERYITLFKTLISTCVGTSATLGFCQSVIQLLDRNAEFVDNAETLWRMWSEVTHPLHDYINQTSEVNQGDALEHNFGCMYAVLTFPITNGLPSKIPQPSMKTLLKTLTQVYSSFARLSALVTNAEANICCEDLYHTLLKNSKKENLKDTSMLDFMFQACAVTVTNIDFSSLGTGGAFNINGLSPAKWKKVKQKPMENIHSFTVMLGQLLTVLVLEIEGDGLTGAEKKPSTASLQSAANNAIEVLSSMFHHLTASNVLTNVIGQLAEPIGEFYNAGAKKLSSKIFSNAFMQKMEKLWTELCTGIQTRYKGQFDSDFLLKFSPLLESTFLHPRRGIKNQTTSFWNSTFSKASSLVYPEKIKPVLLKVKDKTSISLPGWVSTDIPVIEETPVSQMSQAESQAPEPHIPGMPSPHKVHGSFLNKAVSPNIKKSPAKKAESKPASKAKKDLLSDLKNDDFVVIKTPPKKKMVLTEHQKEMFKEKRAIPALYNSLDASQDVSLMSQFTTDTQQETLTPTPTPTTDPQNPIWIFSQSQNDAENKSTKDMTTENTSTSSSSMNTENGSSQMTSETKGPGRKPRRSLSGSNITNGDSKPATRRSVRFSLESNDGKEASSQHFANIWDSTNLLSGRSVRSSPSKDKELTSSQEKFCDIWDAVSKDGEMAVSGGIDHFKVIKDTIVQETNVDSTSIKSSTGSANGKSSIDSANGKSSTDSASGKSTSSSGMEVPQNQLEAVSFDPLVTSTSSSDKCSPQSSGETNNKQKEKMDSENSQPLKSDSENSQPLLKWTKQLEELSQSVPVKI